MNRLGMNKRIRTEMIEELTAGKELWLKFHEKLWHTCDASGFTNMCELS